MRDPRKGAFGEGVMATTMSGEVAARWVAEAQLRVDPLRAAIAANGGHDRNVTVETVLPVDAPYGEFMLTWPVPDGGDFVLQHLPDGEFFLRLLERCYSPVLEREPKLRSLLRDGSRLEVAFTNDVLQVQAAGPPGPYSMIRHHALVLYAATRWLDDSQAAGWLEIYSGVADAMMAQRSEPPTATELAETEQAAFEAFEVLAGETLNTESALQLLEDPHLVDDVLRYLTFAASAISVLHSLHSEVQVAGRGDWMEGQLHRVTHDDYLLEEWRNVLGGSGRGRK